MKYQDGKGDDMKGRTVLGTAVAAALSLSMGCGLAAAAEETKEDLIVFAAASMTETLTQIKDLYEAEHPEVSIVYNFESSGTLKTQIQEGAECDLFISAGQKQMNQMDAADATGTNEEGLDLIDSDTRVDILENKVTLVVPDGNPKEVKDFADLAEKLKDGDILMAMGNEDVPVGQYTQKILTYFDLNEEELAKAGTLTYCSNVKEVTTQISEASVDCGVIYCTDAFSAGLEIVDYATPEMCGQIIYPAAVIKDAEHAEAAEAFLEYLFTDECGEIFSEVGFTPISGE